LDNNLQTLGLLLRSAQMGFESAQRRAPAFISFACPKETNQRKRHPTTCPSPLARGSLRFSRFPARVNSLPSVGQTCTRLPPEIAAMLGCINGMDVH
jgi:hypothetical protein